VISLFSLNANLFVNLFEIVRLRSCICVKCHQFWFWTKLYLYLFDSIHLCQNCICIWIELGDELQMLTERYLLEIHKGNTSRYFHNVFIDLPNLSDENSLWQKGVFFQKHSKSIIKSQTKVRCSFEDTPKNHNRK